MRDVRVAAVVCGSVFGDAAENLRQMRGWVRAAKDKGAEIVCFPEMNVTGYAATGMIRAAAQRIPGPAADALSEMAAAEGMVILAGLAEIDSAGQLFAAHVVVRPDGELGVYRKLHLSPPEQKTYARGEDLPLFYACGLKFGIQLCYDAHFPELSTLMALEGAHLIFIPHASPRGTAEEKYQSWMRHLTARAYDNSLYIVVCNPVGTSAAELSFPGLAIAIDPSGMVMGKYLSESEGMLIADIRADAIERVRGHRMRFFLPNRREDLLRRLQPLEWKDE